MRRITYSALLFLILSLPALSQTGGINFQGMARSASGEPLANQKISLRFSVLLNTESGTVEYSETKEANTSGQGVFSVVIGDGNMLTKTGNFSDINWKNAVKFLKVELDPSGGTNFALMGTSRLQAVPFAYYANGVDADNIQGTLPVAKGGTGVGSIIALKTSLGLDQLNNTSDANKPLSSDAQAALGTKVDKVTGKELSSNDYSAAEKTKLAAITGTNTGDQDLTGFATTTALLGKVDKVTGKELSSNDYSAAEKTKLAAITGTNTGDQDLTGFATTTALALKANTSDVTTSLGLKANAADLTTGLATKVDKVTGKELSTNDYSSAEKTKLAAITGTNTGDQDLSGYASTPALTAKANATDVTASLALKENIANKSSATDLGAVATSDVLFPTQKAVKTYVDGQINSGGISDGSILARHIADANITTALVANAAITDIKIANGINKSKVGLDNVENTTDLAKPISTATQTALDLKATISSVNGSLDTKVNKVTGKELSTNDYTNAEKTKLAGITGTNTGDNAVNSNYSTLLSNATHTGEVTGSTSLTIANAAVTTTKIADAAITNAKVNDVAATKITGILATTKGGTGVATTSANTLFAGPDGISGAPGFRTLVAADIPQNLGGYIQNSPSSAQAASIHISGSMGAGSIQNTPIGNTAPSTASFTTLTSTGNGVIEGTLTVSGVASFASAPILSYEVVNRPLFTNANRQIVSNTTTGTGNVVMSHSPTITGTVTFENLAVANDIVVNGLKIGRGAGNKETNSVLGINAFISNTLGEGNIAIGVSSLSANTIGNNNFAAGQRSLVRNTEGNDNISIGFESLPFNTTGNFNLALGHQSLYSNTTGDNNFGSGYQSLFSNTTGDNNIGIGLGSLFYNTTGNNNFSSGIQSLFSNTTGSNNTAIGYASLNSNTTGINNFAIGSESLRLNTTGTSNLAIGYSSLYANTTGSNNFAVGQLSLVRNTEGNNNISIGFETLPFNTIGDNNLALGLQSLFYNSTGDNNLASGTFSLFSNTTGSNNVALGNLSGYNISTGSNNMTLGYDAQPSIGTVSNEITLGNASIARLRAQVTSITALSDRRDKADIVTISEGIDFIKQLKPVTFTWNTRDQAKVGIKSAGFIAQDLLALQKSSPIGENLDLVSENNPEKLEARYNNLLPVLVKAIQDQQQVIEDQKTRLDALEKLVQQLIQANGNGSAVAPASDKK